MAEEKLTVYTKKGEVLGYFRQPKINQYGNDEYEVEGNFYDSEGNLVERLDFNPQALPYWAEFKDAPNLSHTRLTNVYVQKGRQPIIMSGLGS